MICCKQLILFFREGRTKTPWDPVKYLWQICKKYGYDPYIAKDIIEVRIGQTLVCECQVLRPDLSIRRKELRRSFGIDFGTPGRRDLDIR